MTPDSSALHGSLRRALRRARDGVALDATEAEVLLHARGDDLLDLMASAARTRDAGLASIGRSGQVTYSRKVFIPLTRLCRDRCHYCTFATGPHNVPAPYLSIDEVLQIARDGQAANAAEALFTLGDRPEDRWPQARQWLDEQGYDSTLGYVRAAAIAVLEETGLLPHINAGVMSWAEMMLLKPVSPSMGLMIEQTAERLWSEPGMPHHGSPDKEPKVRLQVLEDAGRHNIPFTTGLLVGIGETNAELIDGILAIKAGHKRHGHVQEVLIQNFRAKPRTAMAGHPDVADEAYLATLAVTRLLLGPAMRLQAPPNLSDRSTDLIAAGVDDLGGISPVTPDHVNPERSWPEISQLTDELAAVGFELVERLTVHPPFIGKGEPWVDPRLVPHLDALRDPRTNLRDPSKRAGGLPWQEPDDAWGQSTGRNDHVASIDVTGRTDEARSDLAEVYGDWDEVAAHAARTQIAPERLPSDVQAALRQAAVDPAGLSDDAYLALITAEGPALEAVVALADEVRRQVVGDDVTYVVNRNINFTNVCYTGCRFCAFAQRRTDADAYTLSLDEVAERSAEAWDRGATEVCLQGGIHPDLPGTAYADIARAIKQRSPDLHIHAFSPMEVSNAVARTGRDLVDVLTELKEAGVGSLPGTAAEILDDDVRWVLTKGKLPTAAWIEVVSTAHRVGLPTSSTMMYGHVDHPHHWVAHLRTLSRIQDDTGGFTEFVPLPFVHHAAPLYLAGVARPGPSARDDRAVHAVARLMLHGRIDNIQCSWVKLGDDGVRTMLRGGVNDLGGTLMEETISRMAGSEHGSARTAEELEALAVSVGRPGRQRTTTYGLVDRAEQRSTRRYEPQVSSSRP